MRIQTWSCRCGCRFHGVFDWDVLIGIDACMKDECGNEFLQTIHIDDSQVALNLMNGGACPVCDGWEDGNGNPVIPLEYGYRLEDE